MSSMQYLALIVRAFVNLLRNIMTIGLNADWALVLNCLRPLCLKPLNLRDFPSISFIN